jgi:hypothetical protein
MSFEKTVGSRAQVWHGTAKKTKGGLTKSGLLMNKHGRIVSKKMHFTAKKQKRLIKAGYITKKGHFGFIKHGTKERHSHKGSRKMRGGVAYGGPLSPLSYNGQGVGTSGVDLQFVAGNATGGGKRSRRMKGGMAYGGPLSPLSYNGQGVGTSGVDLQFVAGNAA